MARPTNKSKLDAQAKGDTKKVDDIRAKYESYYNATLDLRTRIVESHDFVKGGIHQWRDADASSLRADRRPIQSFNATSAIVNFLAGYALEREQDYRAFPRGLDDERLGRLMSAMMKYFMDIGRGTHVTHQWFRRGIIGGLAVLEVGHTYDNVDDLVEGEGSLTVLPDNAWYCEVGARRYDRQDAAFQGKMMWMTPDECKREWPTLSKSFETDAYRDWTTQDPALSGIPEHIRREFYDEKTGRIRILQHWYRVPVEVNLVVNTETGDVKRMEDSKDAERYMAFIRDTAGKQAAAPYKVIKAKSQSALQNNITGQFHAFNSADAAERALEHIKTTAGAQAASLFERIERDTTALRVAHLTGWQLLDDGPSERGYDWRFPFNTFICYQDDDDYLGIKGVVEDIKDPQREINWHHATMLDMMIRSPKGGIWIDKAANANIPKLQKELPRAGFIGEYSGQPPIPIVPTPLSAADMAMLEFGVEAIMRISGINAELMGQTTQKTVSGRAIGARQSGGLVGVGSLFANWAESKRNAGDQILRCIQRNYSEEKMDRVIGQVHRMQPNPTIFGTMRSEIPDDQMGEYFKQLKNIDMDIVVGFQEASATARMAVMNQLMQLKAAGAPIPMEIILEASDVPYKQEIKAILSKQGAQPPNPELAKVIGAGQGSAPAGPTGVNTTQ